MQLSLHQQLNSLPYNCQCGRAPLQSSLATATPTDHVPWPDWFKNASYGPGSSNVFFVIDKTVD